MGIPICCKKKPRNKQRQNLCSIAINKFDGIQSWSIGLQLYLLQQSCGGPGAVCRAVRIVCFGFGFFLVVFFCRSCFVCVYGCSKSHNCNFYLTCSEILGYNVRVTELSCRSFFGLWGKTNASLS